MTCDDQIQVIFTWIAENGDSNDEPPPYVAIMKDSIASWDGETGNCANGLGHPEVNKVSSGLVYELFADPPAKFSRYVTPLVSAEALNPFVQPESATGYVGIRFKAYPIEIKLTGVLDAETDRRLMIGQNLGAYVSIGSLPMGTGPTYLWNVSAGNPFQSWNINTTFPDSAWVTGFAPQTTATLSTYLRTPDPFNVTCSFYWPWLNTTLTLTEDGKAVKPEPLVTTVLIVDPEVVPDLTDPVKVWLHQTGPPSAHGIKWYGEIDTPDDFDNGGDGWWTIVQLVTNNRTRDGLVPWDTRPSPDIKVNGMVGLDASFPYPTPWGPDPNPYVEYDFTHVYEFPADGSNHFSADSPTAITLDISSQVHDLFNTYYIYYPPGTSQYIPLKSLDWSWKAHLHSQSPPYNWVWDAQESDWDYSGYMPPHPTWSYRHDTRFWEHRSP